MASPVSNFPANSRFAPPTDEAEAAFREVVLPIVAQRPPRAAAAVELDQPVTVADMYATAQTVESLHRVLMGNSRTKGFFRI